MKKRFTLIELIVILAIIGIMTTLLIQAMSYGMHTLKKVQCAENLSDIHVLTQQYISDNNGYFPRTEYSSDPFYDHSWDDILSKYDGRSLSERQMAMAGFRKGHSSLELDPEENSELVDMSELYRCPEDQTFRTSGDLRRSYHGNRWNGYNFRTQPKINAYETQKGIMRIANGPNEKHLRVTQVSRLSESIEYMEGGFASNRLGNRYGSQTMGELAYQVPGGSKYGTGEVDYWSHATDAEPLSMNFLFLDGHVTFLDNEETRTDSDGNVQTWFTTDTMWDCFKK